MLVNIGTLVARKEEYPKILTIYKINRVFTEGKMISPQVFIELELVKDLEKIEPRYDWMTGEGEYSSYWSFKDRKHVKLTPEELANKFRKLTPTEQVLYADGKVQNK